MSQLPMMESEHGAVCCRWSRRWMQAMLGFGTVVAVAIVALVGYVAGTWSVGSSKASHESNSIPSIPPEFLRAAATHGSSNLAVCTGQVDEESEGLFTLDFLTGELKGWVYYPRYARIGGFFATNVQPFLGVNKNPEYLLVTGNAITVGQSSNARPAQTMIYVVDAKSGYFAAFTIPWNRPAANSGTPQNGTFVFIDGGQVREPQAGAKKPINPPAAPGGAPGAAPANPGAANPGVGAPGPGQPK